MLQQQPLPLQRVHPPPSGRWRSRLYRVIVIVGTLLSPIGLILGLLARRSAAKSWDHKDRWNGIKAFALLFTLGYIALAWFLHVYTFFWHTLTLHAFIISTALSLLELWGYHILLAPVFALALEWVKPQTHTFVRQPRGPQPAMQVEPLQEPAPAGEDTEAPSRLEVPHIIVRTPTSRNGSPIIGQPLEGDLWQWVEEGRFTWPTWLWNEGALILARPGSGKTKTAMRLAYLARIFGRKVYCFDGKGDWDTAAEFDLVMRAAGCHRVGMFPGDRHHGWFGSREEIVNRLMNCQVFSDSYYEGHTLNILNDAFYLPGHDIPRSSQELLERIYPPTIKALYKGRERYTYYQTLRPDVLWGAYGRYSALFNTVGNGLDGEHGYGYWDAAYYLLDQKRLQKQESTFAKLLLDDFELYIAMRNASVPANRRQPIMLIIDDYSAFSDMVPIHNLMERLRGAGVAVVAIAHGMESLGTEREAKRLLTSAGTVILHACSLPKELIEVAGTRRTADFAYHMQPDTSREAQGSVFDQPGQTTIVMREESSIDPNDVQQLGKGESFWASGGLYQRVQVEMVPVAKALVEERKEQLQLRDRQEREQYQAEQAARLALPAKATKAKTPRKRKEETPAPGADQTNQDGQMPETGQASTSLPVKPKKLQDLL